MTTSDERVAAEMGRALMALYRAGMQVRVWPDALSALYAAVERMNTRAGAIVVQLD